MAIVFFGGEGVRWYDWWSDTLWTGRSLCTMEGVYSGIMRTRACLPYLWHTTRRTTPRTLEEAVSTSS